MASADYYIVQEKATKKCKVVETRPSRGVVAECLIPSKIKPSMVRWQSALLISPRRMPLRLNGSRRPNDDLARQR